MTREEEIKQEVENYPTESAYSYRAEEAAFGAGAKWADEHPKNPWISVKDELPSEWRQVLTMNQDGIIAVSYYRGGLWWHTRCVGWETNTGGRTKIEWTDTNTDITHWMPIPELPKGE